jgi:hypothetical protein
VITIDCLICGDGLKTKDVTKAAAFNNEHVKTCGPVDQPSVQPDAEEQS